MQQRNTGKIIAAFLLVTALAVVSVFSVLQFIKEPTSEQIAEYKAENNITDKSTVAGLTTEGPGLDWLTESTKTEEKTTEFITTEEEKTTEEKTTEKKTTEEKTTEEKTTEEKTTEKKPASGKLELADIAGEYTGKGVYKKFKVVFPDEMFEGMSESEIKMAMSMIESLEGTSFDIAFSVDEDGEWDFDMQDGLMDLDFDSYDFNMPITELKDNGFSMSFSGKDEGIDGEANFSGEFSDANNELSVEGVFSLDMNYEGADMELIVEFEATLEDKEGV